MRDGYQRSVCLCVWEWQSRQAGREGGSWTTYVNLSDRYVNNATHNYQGIKCVPCINKIMLRGGGQNRKTTEEKKRTQHKTFKKNGNKSKERGEKNKIKILHT